MCDTTIKRPQSTLPEIEEGEHAWWAEFSELEDRFAWVQTSKLQRILRGRYIRRFIDIAGKNGRILELGCGTGWLSVALAEHGAREVLGVDFAPAQIARAHKLADTRGVGDRVHFRCADGTSQNDLDGNFDCVIIHAFLHHLDQYEIRRTLESIPRLLNSNGQLIVFEPIIGRSQLPRGRSIWERLLARMSGLANVEHRWRIGHDSAEELKWRELFQKRNVGIPPHGPSPKEMPFEPGELESYLSQNFSIEMREPCMAMSHLVVQQWLLREVSHPLSIRLMLPAIARLASYCDRRLVRQSEQRNGTWVFYVFACRVRRAGDDS